MYIDRLWLACIVNSWRGRFALWNTWFVVGRYAENNTSKKCMKCSGCANSNWIRHVSCIMRMHAVLESGSQ
jgi:hypothetical protein